MKSTKLFIPSSARALVTRTAASRPILAAFNPSEDFGSSPISGMIARILELIVAYSLVPWNVHNRLS